jgi:hypothetical protein
MCKKPKNFTNTFRTYAIAPLHSSPIPPNWIDPIEPVKNTCCQEARTDGNNLGLKKEGEGSGEWGRIGEFDTYFLRMLV